MEEQYLIRLGSDDGLSSSKQSSEVSLRFSSSKEESLKFGSSKFDV